MVYNKVIFISVGKDGKDIRVRSEESDESIFLDTIAGTLYIMTTEGL